MGIYYASACVGLSVTLGNQMQQPLGPGQTKDLALKANRKGKNK